jgi:transglutaminase-like putative cysteine protease
VKALRDTRIPRTPLLWLAAALLFTLPPTVGSLAPWIPCLFLLMLALKFWMEPKGYRLRSPAWKLVLVAAILAAIYFSYGTLRGIEPGVSLIVLLTSLKLLEAHTAIEFHIMVMMAWLLCLCGFFLSQDFAVAVCLFTAFTLLVVALIQFHRGSSPAALWPPLTTACKLLAQATPLVVLLFLLFPRVNMGFWVGIHDLRSATSGFSDRLSPGSIASLANSSDTAFRAEFPDSKTRPPGPMYWRGAVMWHCGGLEWRAPYAPAALSDSSGQFLNRKAIRQRITLAPHGGRWMFALDRPFAAPRGAMLVPGDYLWSFQPIRKARRYEVVSSSEVTKRELQPHERQRALELPASISPRVRELAQSWTAENSNPRTIVNNALRFFRTNRFRYSLLPGEYGKNDLDQFLFRRRVGFCEHYAASFATLMRLAGIPARVVVGYLGGEYNDLGHFFLVRQADTHAWCEVWLPGNGWTRVDPTTVVAPGRASLDLNSYLARSIASGEAPQSAFVTQLTRSAILRNLRLGWEAVSFEWDTHVLGFDADVQESWLASLGIADSGPFLLIVEILIVATALLVIYGGWLQLRTHPRADQVKALYERFCGQLVRLGVRRDSWEGPSDFATRAAQLLPNDSERIQQISNTYIALRYAPEPAATGLDRFAKQVRGLVSHSR